jgi:hypothetical protein
MNDEASRPQGPRITWVEILAGLTALLLLASMFLPACSRFSARGNITTGIANCRQIVLALNLYAYDHDGFYPDSTLENPKSANEVFRILFQEGTIESEAMFGCPLSPFVPDGNIGYAKNRSQALAPGENHWALMRDLTEHSSGNIPLVFENPVIATWPPKWNPDAKGTPVRGRAWSTGIIIGFNDGRAQIVPIASKKGTEVGLEPDSETGKDLFEQAFDSKDDSMARWLDVELPPGR